MISNSWLGQISEPIGLKLRKLRGNGEVYANPVRDDNGRSSKTNWETVISRNPAVPARCQCDSVYFDAWCHPHSDIVGGSMGVYCVLVFLAFPQDEDFEASE
jgi:hypothetical protein